MGEEGSARTAVVQCIACRPLGFVVSSANPFIKKSRERGLAEISARYLPSAISKSPRGLEVQPVPGGPGGLLPPNFISAGADKI